MLSPCPARLGCNSYKAKFALGVAEDSLISGSKEKLVAGQDSCPILQLPSGDSATALQEHCRGIASVLIIPCDRILTVLALLSVNEKIFAGEVGSAELYRGRAM